MVLDGTELESVVLLKVQTSSVGSFAGKFLKRPTRFTYIPWLGMTYLVKELIDNLYTVHIL